MKKRVLVQLLLMPLVLSALIFLPAGTFAFWPGWLFMVVFSVVTIALTAYLIKNDPALLERRMKAGPWAEKRGPQRAIMLFISTAFIGIFIIAGMDFRFGWSHMSKMLIFGGDALIFLSYYIFFEVFKENSFASATIELAEDHKVISTGLYGIVRHPMYMGSLFFMAGIPMALGSWWACILTVALAPTLVWRIADEEKMLKEELKGYGEYCQKVRYRLIPFIY